MPLVVIDHYKVQEIKVLTRMPKSAEAMALLQKVVNQVQPIMRKRKLRVPLVSEFFPNRSNLMGLNINGGGGSCQEIKIRLRHSSNKSSFKQFNSVLGTMLHELCHNTISPHNKAFFTLLDELWEECEALMDKGISGTGEGFDAPAAGKVGGRFCNPSKAELKDAMLKAAEVRARRNGLMQSGPHRLGGGRLPSNLPPAQAAALAAERRAQAQAACGCDEIHGTQLGYDEERGEVIVLDDDDDDPGPRSSDSNTAAAGPSEQGGPDGRTSRDEESRIAGKGSESRKSGVIDLTLSSDDEEKNPAASGSGREALLGRPGGSLQDRGNESREGVGASKRLRVQKTEVGSWEWSCSACTFLNPPWTEVCSMCSARRTSK